MTCRLYADRKGWNLRRVSAEVEREALGRGGTEIYRKRVVFEGELDSAQRERAGSMSFSQDGDHRRDRWVRTKVLAQELDVRNRC